METYQCVFIYFQNSKHNALFLCSIYLHVHTQHTHTQHILNTPPTHPQGSPEAPKQPRSSPPPILQGPPVAPPPKGPLIKSPPSAPGSAGAAASGAAFAVDWAAIRAQAATAAEEAKAVGQLEGFDDDLMAADLLVDDPAQVGGVLFLCIVLYRFCVLLCIGFVYCFCVVLYVYTLCIVLLPHVLASLHSDTTPPHPHRMRLSLPQPPIPIAQHHP